MGYFNRAAIVTGPGTRVSDGENKFAPEQLLAQWEKLTDLQNAKEYWNAIEQIGDLVQSTSLKES
jgi:hypothetical protein